MFSGTLVALATPFNDGQVDWKKLDELVDFQLAEGTDGIVPMGTTGESPTLSHPEHERVIEAVVKRVGGKVPVVAGTGSNSTSEAIHLTSFAQKVGADGALVVNPYYNKPTQQGLYEHFKTVADEVDIPIILYNIPGRCGVALSMETICRLAEIKNIVGIKEATGVLDVSSEIATSCDLTILSGDDSLTLPIMAVGGKGVISVAANIVPTEVRKLTSDMLAGNITKATAQHQKLFKLFKAMFIETNPIPVKTALALMGKCREEFRLPMCRMSPANKEKLTEVLREYKLI